MKVSEQRIKRTLRWLREHYTDEYTPRIYKSAHIADNFVRIEDAMKRQANGKFRNDEERAEAVSDMVCQLRSEGWTPDEKGLDLDEEREVYRAEARRRLGI
jgi:hypothetical protein